jgi:hypothetical protein
MAQLSNAWRKQLLDRLSSLNMSQSVLSSLSGITPNKLSSFFVGTKALENGEITMLYNLLVECEKLSEIAKPIPVDFKNLLGLREALDALRLNDLRPASRFDQATA